jgi:hypothetical protein
MEVKVEMEVLAYHGTLDSLLRWVEAAQALLIRAQAQELHHMVAEQLV